MRPFSYNETKNRQIELRHIFLPGLDGLIAETVIGILALIVFNLRELVDHLIITKNFNGDDPLPLWGETARNLLNTAQDHNFIQEILLFSLWAVAGALLYVLAFRVLQAMFGAKTEVSSGVRYVRQYHSWGMFYWLLSLHDLFVRMLIMLSGVAAIILGISVCFAAASHELGAALHAGFPSGIWHMLFSLVAAVFSVRLIVLGICLLSRRFCHWYAA